MFAVIEEGRVAGRRILTRADERGGSGANCARPF